jgi:pentose-5-phosphate-3-epimerase
MEKLVTIRSFSQSIDFEMAKSYLESYGIKCFGQNEIINRAYINLVDGGINLQVLPEQSEEAIKLLVAGGYLKEEDFEPTTEFKWMEKFLNLFHKK